MLNLDTLKEKFSAAQAQKLDPQYKIAIHEELLKPHWEKKRSSLNKELAECSSAKEFEKYQHNLLLLFNELTEQITAPGVDDFIGWISAMTDSKDGAKDLRSYLVANFANVSLRNRIKNILQVSTSLNPQGSVLNKLMAEVRKNIKTRCVDLLSDTEQIKNKIDGFLLQLEGDLVQLQNMTEFLFTDQVQFYSPEQVKQNISWYADIFSEVVEKSQSLKPIDEDEKEKDMLSRVKARINGIRSALTLLDKTNIANNEDEVLKNLFFKFKDEMIKFEGGIKNNLSEFLEKKWSVVEENYVAVKKIFDTVSAVEYKSEWNDFPRKEQIQSFVLLYKALIKDNPLPNLLKQTPLGIQQTLTKKVNAVNEYEKSCSSLKEAIVEEYQKIITEYSTNKVPQLEELCKKEPQIKVLVESLKEQLEGLKNSQKTLENESDVLGYLKSRFSDDLSSYLAISSYFTQALHDSGKIEHLKWLETVLKGSKVVELEESELKNKAAIIGELISVGLIKLKIEKPF